MIDLDRILPEQHPEHADAWLADGLAALDRADQLGAARTPTYGSWSRTPTLEAPCPAE